VGKYKMGHGKDAEDGVGLQSDFLLAVLIPMRLKKG
jgi:hypothetical protein